MTIKHKECHQKIAQLYKFFKTQLKGTLIVSFDNSLVSILRNLESAKEVVL